MPAALKVTNIRLLALLSERLAKEPMAQVNLSAWVRALVDGFIAREGRIATTRFLGLRLDCKGGAQTTAISMPRETYAHYQAYAARQDGFTVSALIMSALCLHYFGTHAPRPVLRPDLRSGKGPKAKGERRSGEGRLTPGSRPEAMGDGRQEIPAAAGGAEPKAELASKVESEPEAAAHSASMNYLPPAARPETRGDGGLKPDVSSGQRGAEGVLKWPDLRAPRTSVCTPAPSPLSPPASDGAPAGEVPAPGAPRPAPGVSLPSPSASGPVPDVGPDRPTPLPPGPFEGAEFGDGARIPGTALANQPRPAVRHAKIHRAGWRQFLVSLDIGQTRDVDLDGRNAGRVRRAIHNTAAIIRHDTLATFSITSRVTTRMLSVTRLA